MVCGVTHHTIKGEMTKKILPCYHIQFLDFARIVTHYLVDIKNGYTIQQYQRILLKQRAVGTIEGQKKESIFSFSYHHPFDVFPHDFFHGWKPGKFIQ